ncbi:MULTISPECIES: hypothetical protein [Shouchella]|uniref:STAS domain-containing protein n=2 Tax=Shouchella TaxID=2893057 RepID=A0ABY7W1P4_9BACI|nr:MULTISPECIES: hypothetical protein [Shouchella]MED4129386.1 hypothetical protein [Shouchella miscanthi]WDF02481.1 hypothetical protein PQ477_13225 [Shouchella hunanensis]
MYSMSIDERKKQFTIVVSGFITEEEADAYKKDYIMHAASIDCSDYTLILDGSDMMVSKQSMLDGLKALIQSYVNHGYKEILFVQAKSPSARAQLRRIDVLMKNVRLIEVNDV